MEENKEISIDLRKIFSMLKKKAVFIAAVALIAAVLAGCITNFFIEPKYTATIKMHVYSNSDNRIGANSSISSNEIDASQKLVNTYLVVVTSNTFTEKVADKIGNGITSKQILSMMSCSQIEETLAFQVSVTSTDRDLAVKVANAIADTCPDEIKRILKVGGAEVIDYAIPPTAPSSPNLQKNIIIGFLFGFIISFIFFFIKDLFDTSIHDEQDLEREFDIPILGTVPRLVPSTENPQARSDTKSRVNISNSPFDIIKTEKEDSSNG